jgi:PLP dependent protein
VSIAQNIAQLQERITAAARRAGRNPSEVQFMAVSKTFAAEAVREAYAAGLRVFGESRVQEFAGKAVSLSDLQDIEWHMIGHLQTNKAAKALEFFGGVDSVDSLRLAEKLNAAAGQAGKKIPVLIEINIGGEQAKSGVAPGSTELEQILVAAPKLKHLEIHGLMTVPPFTEDAEGSRPFFCKLCELRNQIAGKGLPSISMGTLSMGMSHDFEVAIEEGSTCVRIGTAVFGGRKRP